MEKKRRTIIYRVLASVLAFLIFTAVLQTVREHSVGGEELIIEDLGVLELHNMERRKRRWLRAVDEDPYAVLSDVNRIVTSVEVNVRKLRKNRSRDVAIELYYDTGSGFNENECVKTHLAKGVCRFYLPSGTYVKSIRFDFFDEDGNSIKIRAITINPQNAAETNAWPVFLAAAMLLIVLGAVSAHSGRMGFVGGLATWFCLCLAAGIPVILNIHTDVRVPALLLAGSVYGMLLVAFFGQKRKEKLYCFFLLVSVFLLCFMWCRITAYWDAPDETMHYAIVKYIRRYGTIPRGDEESIRNSTWGFSYAYYPMLPYIISGFVCRLVGLFVADPSYLMLTRAVNAAAGTVAAFFAWKIGKRLFPDSPMRFAFPVVLTFFPEFAYLNTYVNTDSFALMSSVIIVYFWISGIQEEWRTRDAVGLSIGMAICALSYYYYYGFILMSVPLFFATVSRTGRNGRAIAKMTALIVALTFALCGWWFIRNGMLYDGDFLGRTTLNNNAEIYAIEGFKPSQLTSPQKEGISPVGMLLNGDWLPRTLRSFVAMYSNYSLRAQHYVYRYYRWFFGISGAGALCASVGWFRKRHARDLRRKQFASLWRTLLIAMIIPVLLAFYYSYTSDYQPQGRYMMGCVVPLMIFAAKGIEWIARAISERIHKVKISRAFRIAIPYAVMLLSASVMVNDFLSTVCNYYI